MEHIDQQYLLDGLYCIDTKGIVTSFHKKNSGKEISKRIDRAGYYTIRLTQKNVTKTFFLHRLIAESFIPNPEVKPYVNHINGNKLNNSISNLEWCKHKENMNHAFASGLCLSPEKNSKWVVNTETGECYSSIKEAASLFQIPYSTLKNYFAGRRKNKWPFAIRRRYQK